MPGSHFGNLIWMDMALTYIASLTMPCISHRSRDSNRVETLKHTEIMCVLFTLYHGILRRMAKHDERWWDMMKHEKNPKDPGHFGKHGELANLQLRWFGDQEQESFAVGEIQLNLSDKFLVTAPNFPPPAPWGTVRGDYMSFQSGARIDSGQSPEIWLRDAEVLS